MGEIPSANKEHVRCVIGRTCLKAALALEDCDWWFLLSDSSVSRDRNEERMPVLSLAVVNKLQRESQTQAQRQISAIRRRAAFLTLPLCERDHVECFSACIDRLLSSSSLPVRPAGPGQSLVQVSACVCVRGGRGVVSPCLLYIQLSTLTTVEIRLCAYVGTHSCLCVLLVKSHANDNTDASFVCHYLFYKLSSWIPNNS